MSGDLLSTPSTPPMSAKDRAVFAKELREKLNSRRDVFVIDKFMFEPQEGGGDMQARRVEHATGPSYPRPKERNNVKNVSAATLRLLLDYCESAWDMDFVSYCAGIFHGREPHQDETAFDLLPDVQSKISADRLGFGHIYEGRQ